ncbi:MAG: asparagine synthase (glutamine-hydrolyzing) [Methylotetracoccus sp.]
MCGLHGNSKGISIGKDALAHRGPDHYGVFRDGGVVLEHWRLSILDLSAKGNQPMRLSPEAGEVIAYNGEVYNFRELARRFDIADLTSGTDTEVVLALYRKLGIEFLTYLNGMFALALYDRNRGTILLARDRFGIKPLYYSIDRDGHLIFASELKALILNHSMDLTLDREAIRSLFHLLYIEGERTPFNEIRKLPPASYLEYELATGRTRIVRYHELKFTENQLSDEECVDAIEDLLARSVDKHLISDVPVGALLSGGVDSSLMVALMTKSTPDVLTYSVGYSDNKLFDESRYFNQVADQYHTRHHHTDIQQDSIAGLFDAVCGELDEPVGDTSVMLNHFIFGFAAESVKVCLSGLGGDELFGGYNRYLACAALPTYFSVPAPLRGLLRSVIKHLPDSRHGAVGNKVRLLKSFVGRVDEDLRQSYKKFVDYFGDVSLSPVLGDVVFGNERLDAYWDQAMEAEMNRIYRYDIENYMVNDLLMITDRMSMRHSLEARVPFLENDLVDFALSISPGKKVRGRQLKVLLKKVAERYIPRDVIYRRKQGFSSPIKGLLTHQVLTDLEGEFDRNRDEYVQILNRDVWCDVIRRHRAGAEDHSLQIFTLMVYLNWMGSVFTALRSARLA